MAKIEPKRKLINENAPVIKQFTDRLEFQEIFWKSINTIDKDDNKVLVFYGVGGIGKTSLRKELQNQLKDKQPKTLIGLLNFEERKHRQLDNALIYLCHSLKSIYKVPFPLFEYSYAIYLKKCAPQLALNKVNLPFLNEGDLVTNILSICGDIPVFQLASKLYVMGSKVIDMVKQHMAQKEIDQLIKISEMEPNEIYEVLPECFSLDLKKYMDKAKVPAVFFIDTYDALWENSRDTGYYHERDKWIRELLVPCLTGVLWVICTRWEVRWNECNAAWNQCLNQYPLGELEEHYAKMYLAACDIQKEDIQKAIIQICKGHPYYLDLSVDTFNIIKRTREPSVEDFYKIMPYCIFERFVKYLNTNERIVLTILSFLNFWDDKLFEFLIDVFKINYNSIQYTELKRFSFIGESSYPGVWSMQNLMRQSLQDYDTNFLKNKVHKTVFGYYSKQLDDIKVKEIDSSAVTALTEAFYHGRILADLNNNVHKLFTWFVEKEFLFNKAAQWRVTIPLYNELGIIVNSKEGIPEKNKILATIYYNIGFNYYTQDDYKNAESFYLKALELGKKLVGEDRLYVAQSMHGMGLLYMHMGMYSKADELYEKSLGIRKDILGGNHAVVAQTLNAWAILKCDMGIYTEAEQLCNKSLTIRKTFPKSESAELAKCYNTLAIIYINLERYAEAENITKQALEIRRKYLNPQNHFIATSLNVMATALLYQGKYCEAEVLCKKALEIKERLFGEEHSAVAEILHTLSNIYKHKGNYAEAELNGLKALNIWEKKYGKQHPDIATISNNLLDIYKNIGEITKAKKMQQAIDRLMQADEKLIIRKIL